MRKTNEDVGRKGLPVTSGEPVAHRAHGVSVKLSTFDGIDVTAAFHAVVNQIVVAKRQPTAWEAGCLYAALCELAIGREKNARRRIRLALLPGPQQELPVSIIPLPTTEELLQALALILTPNRTSPRGCQDPATSEDEVPARPGAD